MNLTVSPKDSKRSLIWSHFTQIGSDNTNMIRSVCNHCKKKSLNAKPTITIRFDSKFQIIAQLFDSILNEKKTPFAQH